MAAFAAASLLLKAQRPDLPRLAVTPVAVVVAALVMVLAGLVGNVLKGPGVVAVFLAYFLATIAVVAAMMERTRLLRLVLRAVRCAVARGGGARVEQLRAAHARNESAKQRGGGVGSDVFSHQSLSSAGWPLLHSLDPRSEECTATSSSETAASRDGVRTASQRSKTGDADVESEAGDFEDPPPGSCGAALLRTAQSQLLAATAAAPLVVFFARDADLPTLVRAVRYVRENEQAGRLCIAHFVDEARARESLEARFAGGDAAVIGLAEGLTAAALAASSADGPGALQIQAGSESVAPLQGPLRPDVALQLLERFLPPLPDEAALLADRVALVDAVCRPEVWNGSASFSASSPQLALLPYCTVCR